MEKEVDERQGKRKEEREKECVAESEPRERDRAGLRRRGTGRAHRERSTPGRYVDGVLLLADAFQAGQGRLLRTFASSGNPTLPTTPIRSACVRGTPTRPSWLYGFLLLPPLQGNAEGQVLGEMIHRGVPSGLHVPGGQSGDVRATGSSNGQLPPKGLARDTGTPGWPLACYVAEGDLKLLIPLPLGLRVHNTTLGYVVLEEKLRVSWLFEKHATNCTAPQA